MVTELVTLKEIQLHVFEEYKRNGYFHEWDAYQWLKKFNCVPVWTTLNLEILKKLQKRLDIAELGLFDTEVTEAKEEIRKKGKLNKVALGFECADIIIRTLNFMSRKGLDAEYFLTKKAEKNSQRDYLHGKDV